MVHHDHQVDHNHHHSVPLRILRNMMMLMLITISGDVEDHNFGNHEVRVDVSDDGGGGITFDEVPRLHDLPSWRSQTPIFNTDNQKLTLVKTNIQSKVRDFGTQVAPPVDDANLPPFFGCIYLNTLMPVTNLVLRQTWNLSNLLHKHIFLLLEIYLKKARKSQHF